MQVPGSWAMDTFFYNVSENLSQDKMTLIPPIVEGDLS